MIDTYGNIEVNIKVEVKMNVINVYMKAKDVLEDDCQKVQYTFPRTTDSVPRVCIPSTLIIVR